MIELKGKYTDCKIFTDAVEDSALEQVNRFINNESFKGLKTRFMPDIHAGEGSVIGTVVELGDRIIPNIVGVDIGCGMLSYKLDILDVDLKALDTFIHENIPSGFRINSKQENIGINLATDIECVCAELGIKAHRPLLSLGTLGGGNHFIELGRDEEGYLWLTVHTGSRNFGLQVANYHQKIAKSRCSKGISDMELRERILKLKDIYTGVQLGSEIAKLKASLVSGIPIGLEFLEGADSAKYVAHMKVAQQYATRSREIILGKIINHLNAQTLVEVESVHNYIDFKDSVIRKGAISAHRGQFVVIPWNMRDGLIIGQGLGTNDWLKSAPHGAGRVLSRTQARNSLQIEDFRESMKGVYSTCVDESTLDESPMAYKSSADVEKYLKETVKVIHRVKPIYNFKSTEKQIKF